MSSWWKRWTSMMAFFWTVGLGIATGGRGILLVVDELAHELGQGGDHIDGEQLAAGDDGGADFEVVLALEILQMEAGAGRIQFEFC